MSVQLIDPELRPILDGMPALATSAETLPAIREAVGAWRLPAPAMSGVRREEVWIKSDGLDLKLLVYTPETAQITGGLLWMFGGGLVSGSPEMSDAPNRYLAKTAGCVVVAPAYRLAPEHRFPAALNDCYAALLWLESFLSEQDIERPNIALAGESAGGCLAAGLALLARDRKSVELSAQFLMFPMLDDRTGTVHDPTPMPFSGEYVWTDVSNRYCWNAALGQGSEADVPYYAAPGRAENLVGLPKTFLSVGDVDTFIGEDLRFAQKLIRDGVSTSVRVYSGAPHGFIAWGATTRIAEQAQQDFWKAIVEHFRNEDVDLKARLG